MFIEDSLYLRDRKAVASSNRAVGIIDVLQIFQDVDFGFIGDILRRIDKWIGFKKSNLTRITFISSAFIKDNTFSIDQSRVNKFSW